MERSSRWQAFFQASYARDLRHVFSTKYCVPSRLSRLADLIKVIGCAEIYKAAVAALKSQARNRSDGTSGSALPQK